MGNLVFQATLGGQVNLVGPNTASTYNINVPTVSGDMVTTGDTGTVTNTMLAGSIANAKLVNSSFTIGSTAVSLGETKTTITGLTLTNPTINGYTGDTSVVNIGSGQFYKDTSGNVGIGTSSPAVCLHTYAASGSNGLRMEAGGTSSGETNRFSFKNASGAADARSGVIEWFDNASFMGDMRFLKAGGVALRNSSDAETFKVDNSGNLQFNSGYGSVATAYGCRAWVNFNGTGTVAIRGDGNVDTITDAGTGRYTVNFTTAMPDANYAVVATCNQATTGNAANNSFGLYATATDGSTGVTRTTTAVQLQAKYGVSSTVQDIAEAHVAIFR
jgi:hypothetical protein